MANLHALTQSVKWRTRVLKLFLHIILIALGFTFTVPMLWVFSTSLKRLGEVFVVPIQWLPRDPQWGNYVEIFTLLPLTKFILNTAKVTVLGTVGSVLSSLFVGYGLSRLRWKVREAVFGLVLATMMLPGVITIIPLFVFFSKLGWVNTHYPLWVPSWFGGAFYVFLIRQFMMGLPYELDEAARVDGASSFRILFQLIAPMCKPAITTIAIFSFLAHYNNFMGPLLYLSDNTKFTLPLGLFFYQGRFDEYWHLVMAVSVISVLPIFFVFWIGQRYFVRGVHMTGLAGR
jgi:ABC-type glycerol-3-phosphate transport system permease component